MRLLSRLGVWEEHRAVRITTTALREASDEAIKVKLRHALDLIYDNAPVLFVELQKQFGGIAAVSLQGADGKWRRPDSLCLINQALVASSQTGADYVAAVLIHELTHARLYAAGFNTTEQNRARVERLCYSAERNFLLRLPVTKSRTRALETVDWAMALPREHWSDSERHDRAVRVRARWPWWRRALFAIGRLGTRQQRSAP